MKFQRSVPPLFLFVGQDAALNDGGVFSDAYVAAFLCGLGLGVSLIGQEQSQAFSLVPDRAAPFQHVENDHVPGIVPEPLHRKLALTGSGK